MVVTATCAGVNLELMSPYALQNKLLDLLEDNRMHRDDLNNTTWDMLEGACLLNVSLASLLIKSHMSHTSHMSLIHLTCL